MINYGLQGKTALVTGAAGGIGSATARLFAQQGVAVALFDRDADGAERVAVDLRREGATAIAGEM
ncbi:MAG: SDR family NAD(P)-dependent oxidoreductase, partial [Comamonadaceae bacterium]